MTAGMATAMSPDYSRIGTLHGDFGPVPALVQADLRLAQGGYLEQYLDARDPGHALHLTTIWLYDHPEMLNDAVANGLTDDQWGMVKERGYNVGPWYLIIPAIIHVEFPGGGTGTGFVLWNLLIALILIFALPVITGSHRCLSCREAGARSGCAHPRPVCPGPRLGGPDACCRQRSDSAVIPEVAPSVPPPGVTRWPLRVEPGDPIPKGLLMAHRQEHVITGIRRTRRRCCCAPPRHC
jgi:hypothetical protein